MKKTLYVDYDGTIVSDKVDKLYNAKAKEIGIKHALKWYAASELWQVPVKRNILILFKILLYKLTGYRVVMFTNRFPHQHYNITNTLGWWVNMFDEFIYGKGYKGSLNLGKNSILWDNDSKYAKCASEFKLIKTYKEDIIGIFGIVAILRVLWEAVTTEAYLSTRISPNTDKGWTLTGNRDLSFVRSNSLGMKVLNPVNFNLVVSHWTGEQYMTLWRIVIRIMAVLGKKMISYTEDIPTSKGCTEERELAIKLGMKLLDL